MPTRRALCPCTRAMDRVGTRYILPLFTNIYITMFFFGLMGDKTHKIYKKFLSYYRENYKY